jgi:aryl-alcohol dehydrogenase-like predicted oxidoreductase
MQTKKLGSTDIQISPIVFGGNVFGWTADKKASFELLDKLLDEGFNTIDTADVYSEWVPGNEGGESEAILGQWLSARGCRGDVVLMTKVAKWGKHPGLSRQNIQAAVEDSLRRLQTDYIDVYFAHEDDQSTPLEESLEAFEALKKAGKVRAVGASNYEAGRLARAISMAGGGLARYDVIQPEYNLHARQGYEDALRGVALEHDLGVVTYFALASGFLTGKYTSKEDIKGQRPRADAGGLL